jgi:hypothetical protein
MEMKNFLRANWDRALAVALVVAGIIALIIGWFGVSGTGLVAEQNPYLISAGLGGIALLIIGCTTWLSSDLQDEWRRMDAIEEQLKKLGDRTSQEHANRLDDTAENDAVMFAAAASNGSSPKSTRRPTTAAKRPATPAAAPRKGGRQGIDPQAERS